MKRYLAALAVGGAVFGTVLASAASLGTITDGTLGSGDGDVAACQSSGLSAEYVVDWDTDSKRYEVTSVEVNGLTSACNGKAIKVALLKSGDVNVGETDADQVVSGISESVTKKSFPIVGGPSAAEVVDVRVTIYGE